MIPLRQFNDLRERLEAITALAALDDGHGGVSGNVGVVVRTDDGEMLLVGLLDNQEEAEAHRQTLISLLAKALTSREAVVAASPSSGLPAVLPPNVLPFKPRTPAGTVHVNLRDSHYAKCRDCDFTWVAPTIAKCPKCSGTNTEVTGDRYFEYARS